MPTDGPLLAAHLLGTFRVSIDGVPVDLTARRRARQVLAYLFVHRRVAVPRDVLTDLFWPDAGPAAARNNLHVTLTGIRRALAAAHPAAIVERRFDAYRLGGPAVIWTDVEQFERSRAGGQLAERRGDRAEALRCLEAASQLYGGEFLADEPYADWAVPFREALRLDAVDALSALVERYAEQGAYGPASVLARRSLTIDPCNEAVHRRLMTCYAATGQRHLALSQYHRLADLLWTTYRVRPAAPTTELFEQLRHPRHEHLARLAS
jgi:DNA-binding SARP family transcriptional activator